MKERLLPAPMLLRKKHAISVLADIAGKLTRIDRIITPEVQKHGIAPQLFPATRRFRRD